MNYTPLGDSMNQLERLAMSKIFGQLLPKPALSVKGDTELERRMRGYIHGNCAGCHNYKDMWDFSHDAPLMSWNVRPHRDNTRLLSPGEPEESAMYRLFASRIMPPLGVQVADDEIIRDMSTWISSLESQP